MNRITPPAGRRTKPVPGSTPVPSRSSATLKQSVPIDLLPGVGAPAEEELSPLLYYAV